MTRTGTVTSIFHEGEEIVLVEGTYQGTLGVFVRFRDDVGWAEIAERRVTSEVTPSRGLAILWRKTEAQ